MIIARHIWALALCLCAVTFCVAFSSPAGAQADAPSVENHILVMVKLPPPHLRPNYEQGSGYGDDPGRISRKRQATRVARELGLTIVEQWPMPLLDVDCFVMKVPKGLSAQELSARASHQPGVVWAQPVQTFHTQGEVPSYNDPLFAAQPAARTWRLPELHQLATGRGMLIAVIDSGVDSNHPDIAGQVAASRNFVEGVASPELHGTAVAGIIAAKANNNAGIVGVAPNARLLALRACRQQKGSETALCTSFSLAQAIQFAIENRAKVINLSLAGPPDLLLGKLLKIAIERGIAVVAPYNPSLAGGGFPASFPGVIAAADERLPSPNRTVYTAPARDVPTTRLGGRWYLVSGNSYAAAHISGLVALLRDKRPRAAASDFVLASTGSGAIDACATLVRVSMPCDCACAKPATARVAR